MPHHVPDVVNQPYDNPPTASSTAGAGSAGYPSVEAVSGTENNSSGRVVGTGTTGAVTAPQSTSALNYGALESAASDRPLSKEEADRLYEQNIEDEYAKREGGA